MADRVILNASQITEITAEGLSYVDEEGKTQRIDFEACFQNHLAEWLSPEALKRTQESLKLSDAKLQERIEKIRQLKYVGGRQPLEPPWDDGPYIEFFTELRIRFKFDTRADYDRTLGNIYAGGWKTLDRS